MAIKIGPGDHYVTDQADEVIVTVLGSCVSACVRDPLARIGGMNHFMLAESETGIWGSAPARLRFGNFAMERLINDILIAGGQRQRLEAKVFGGATMNGCETVGARNAAFVEAYLSDERIAITARDLRGHHARRVHYIPLTGQVRMRELPCEGRSIRSKELAYADRHQPGPADGGPIELF